MEYFENNFAAPPNKIVMWRFLRNPRLILHLHYFQGTHILGASRGGPCDSVASCLLRFCGSTSNLRGYMCMPGTASSPVYRPWEPQYAASQTDQQRDGQTDERCDVVNSRSYCVVIRSAKGLRLNWRGIWTLPLSLSGDVTSCIVFMLRRVRNCRRYYYIITITIIDLYD